MVMALALAACAPVAGPPPEPAAPRTLTVLTHDSFAVSDAVVAAFESEHNAEVVFLKAGDAGTALNKALLTSQPFADVFYGVDNAFLSRALDEHLFEPYESPLLADIPDEFELDPEHGALPVDYGDVCINADLAWFEERGLPLPASLDDLLKPEYAGLLVVQNPATSSPGLAFLLATVGHFGEDGYLDFWNALTDSGFKVVNDWETAYYTEFSRWGGQFPLVVSYASSPPFEVLYAEEPLDEPPTAALVGDGMCFRQIEFAGILRGAPDRDLAEAWLDFMLSPAFQEDIPLQMFVFPVNPNARLDATFVDFLVVPENPAFVSPADIAAHREEWIQAWREVVLR
jgi:thiamine transport system substrate-binding protein